MRNSHKGILSAFLMGLSILVVMQLGSHTTTEIKLASEKTDVTDPKGNLPELKPSQIRDWPEGMPKEEESSSLPATENDPNNPENDPNNPGNGFGAGTAPSTFGLPVPETKPETNPCEVEKAEKGNQLLKAAFGSEKSDCTKFNAEQKKLLKGESKSVPESAPGMQKSSSGMQNSLYYQWCTSRSRNGVIEVREEVTLCPKTFEQCIKTCGFPGNTLYGRTFCETIVGRKEVLSDFCDFPAPPARETRCAPTRPCTKYVQDVAPSCPAKVCDEGASTEIGSVYCTQSASGHAGASYSVGRQVEDSECTYWGHSKPSALTRYCPAAKPCTKYVRGTPPRCPSKTCGVAANHVYGTVRCYTTATNVHVSDSECSYWGHSKPSARNLYCPAAKPCTKYVTRAPYSGCPTSCGLCASITYGSVHCVEVRSGRDVPDSKCSQHWKPFNPTQYCAATSWCQHCTTVWGHRACVSLPHRVCAPLGIPITFEHK